MVQDDLLQQQQQHQQQQQQPQDSSMMMMTNVPFNEPMTSDYLDEPPMQQQQQLLDDYGQPLDPYQQQQQQQDNDYYFDSEYVKAEPSTGLDLSTSSSTRVVLRQDSASSIEPGLEITVKKIEVMEDEYGKMKMALLSDLDQDLDLDLDQDFLPSPCVPEVHFLASQERPPHPPRQRSRDNLESIFGGGPSYTDPVSPTLDLELPNNQPPTTDLLESTTESRSTTHYNTSSCFPPADHHDHQLSAVNYSVEDFHSHKSGRSMIEEPFPVCISPEMELSISGSSVRAGHIDTIPEVPEEEDGSPTAGDGVSRKRRGKNPGFSGFSRIIFSLFRFVAGTLKTSESKIL